MHLPDNRAGLWSVGVVTLSLMFASPAFSDEGHPAKAGTHMKVSGIVSQVKSDPMIIKTPWGQITVKSTDGLKDVVVGEEVEMWVDENNSVIDVHRKGDPRAMHRYITGTLTYSSKDRSGIRLVTPDGERDFPVERGKSRLSMIEEGAPITVEVNEAGKVIDIHRMTVELTLDEAPTTKPGYHITMNGVVTEI